MIWAFIKKYWFWVAFAALVLAAIVRKNLRINFGGVRTPDKKEQPQKYTQEASAAAPGTTMLGLSAGSGSAAEHLPEIDDATAMAFIRRFGQTAVAEQKKFGMPASVLLASAYINSFAGRRDCATEANNFLGLRCTAEWSGPVATFSGQCFRKYNTAWESFRDFNQYLSTREWYAPLKKSAGSNWKAWAKALAAHRVSDVDQYEAVLGKVIEQYQLDELDAKR